VRRAEHGVARVSTKGVEWDDGEGEKVAAVARGESERRLHEGRVLT
jgi:hypothetical protein